MLKNGKERYKGGKLVTLKNHLAVQLKNEGFSLAMKPSPPLRPDRGRIQFIFNSVVSFLNSNLQIFNFYSELQHELTPRLLWSYSPTDS